MMKKLLIVLAVVCLVFAGVVGFLLMQGRDSSAPAPTQAASQDLSAPAADLVPTAEPAAPAAEAGTDAAGTLSFAHVDMEALYNSREPDSVFALIGDTEVTWQEYYEWLGCSVLSAEDYMASMASYGLPMNWADEYTQGTSFADYVVESLNDNLRVYAGVDGFAEANGVEVSAEEVEAQRASDIESVLGEGATEEEWVMLLLENFMTDNIYRRQIKAQMEIDRSYEALYGMNAEKLSTAELQHYIEDAGYLRCNHILLLTLDTSTYTSLDEETVAAKKAQADALAAELHAIEDRDELLARFAELKEEFCEDSGKLYYPDGYIFLPGEMVAAFEDTTRELGLYEVSDPVLSEYGYHIIIRLPIDADTQLDDGSTMAQTAASQGFAARVDEFVDALDFVYAPGAEPVDLTAYLLQEVE